MKIVWHWVERALAFLDTRPVILPDDGSIKTKVLRKEIDKNQHLNFSSNHPLEHKKWVVHTLLHLAEAIVSHPNDREEHLEQVLF